MIKKRRKEEKTRIKQNTFSGKKRTERNHNKRDKAIKNSNKETKDRKK